MNEPGVIRGLKDAPDPLSRVEIAKHLTLACAFTFAGALVFAYLLIHLIAIWMDIVFDASWLIRFASVGGCVFVLMQAVLRTQPLFDRKRQFTDRIIAGILLPLTLAGIVAFLATIQEFYGFLFELVLTIHPGLPFSVYGKTMATIGILLTLAVPILFLRGVFWGIMDYLGGLRNQMLRRQRGE